MYDGFISSPPEESLKPLAYEPLDLNNEEDSCLLRPFKMSLCIWSQWQGSTDQRAARDIVEWYYDAMTFSDELCPQNAVYDGNEY